MKYNAYVCRYVSITLRNLSSSEYVIWLEEQI